jgi:hypothetical protein
VAWQFILTIKVSENTHDFNCADGENYRIKEMKVEKTLSVYNTIFISIIDVHRGI